MFVEHLSTGMQGVHKLMASIIQDRSPAHSGKRGPWGHSGPWQVSAPVWEESLRVVKLHSIRQAVCSLPRSWMLTSVYLIRPQFLRSKMEMMRNSTYVMRYSVK